MKTCISSWQIRTKRHMAAAAAQQAAREEITALVTALFSAGGRG